MLKFIRKFRRSDDGAVTVDWVVLTAAMASFGIGVAAIINTAATDPAEGMGAYLSSIEIE